MPITPKNILHHELIGLTAKIVWAQNPANLNLEGKIVDETYKTLVIETKRGLKRLFKSAVTIEFKLPDGQRVEVDGSRLLGRPWERMKKVRK